MYAFERFRHIGIIILMWLIDFNLFMFDFLLVKYVNFMFDIWVMNHFGYFFYKWNASRFSSTHFDDIFNFGDILFFPTHAKTTCFWIRDTTNFDQRRYKEKYMHIIS